VISKDSIAGFLLLALAAGYWWLTRAIPESSLSDEVGADGLPKVLAAALALVACLLVGKSLLAKRSAAPVASGPDDDTAEQAGLLSALGFVAIGAGYMMLAPLIGFAAGVAALLVTVGVYEREALSVKLLAVAAAGGAGFWLVFVRFLGTDQPTSYLLALLTKS
jgi:putative tricarboxylic transport membrane protein